MQARVLIIEDDQEILDSLVDIVSEFDLQIETLQDGVEGLETVKTGEFDLLLLDLMLPRCSGEQICRAARDASDSLIIIVITALRDELTTVQLLEVGADDYVTKPFREHELRARIKSAMRRIDATLKKEPAELLEFQGLTVELTRRQLFLAGQEVDLTAREFDLLALLAQQPGKPFTREQINRHLYGHTVVGYDRNVISYVKRIRSKIEENSAQPKYLLTARGYGYLFSEEMRLINES